MKKQITIAITLAAATLGGGFAFGQTEGAGSPNNEPMVVTRPAGSLADVPALPYGFALQAGGGVTAYTKRIARDDFKTGGFWDVRAVIGNRSFLGAELAYVGSAREIAMAGTSSSPSLVSNGGEAVVRANLPLQAGDLQVTPFAFGGIGWTHYSVASGNGGVGINDSTNAGVVPFGAGVTAGYAHFVADARFTYRTMFSNDLVPTANGDHLDMQNWSAGLTVGYEL
jgi:hypothetical protein